jgi:hypothetical protein
MIDKPGGLSVGVALAQARANLDTLQSKSQGIIVERIAELAALAAPAASDPDGQQRLTQAYHLSSAVIDAAGPFELYDLCAVAAGLCDLIDAAPADRPFDWRIVTVHAQSMQLILTLPPEAVDARAQVMASLKQVLDKKIPGEAQSGT